MNAWWLTITQKLIVKYKKYSFHISCILNDNCVIIQESMLMVECGGVGMRQPKGHGRVKRKWHVQISSEVAVYGQTVGKTNVSICFITSKISYTIMCTFTLGLCLGS